MKVYCQKDNKKRTGDAKKLPTFNHHLLKEEIITSK